MKNKLIASALFLLLIVLVAPATIAFVDIMTWFYTGHSMSGFDWSYERAFVAFVSCALTIPIVGIGCIVWDTWGEK